VLVSSDWYLVTGNRGDITKLGKRLPNLTAGKSKQKQSDVFFSARGAIIQIISKRCSKQDHATCISHCIYIENSSPTS
jgi:hypothetical protein